jgi:hypothetical protein
MEETPSRANWTEPIVDRHINVLLISNIFVFQKLYLPSLAFIFPESETSCRGGLRMEEGPPSDRLTYEWFSGVFHRACTGCACSTSLMTAAMGGFHFGLVM